MHNFIHVLADPDFTFKFYGSRSGSGSEYLSSGIGVFLYFCPLLTMDGFVVELKSII